MAITDGPDSPPRQRDRDWQPVLDPIVPSVPSRDLGWTKWVGDDAEHTGELTIIRGVD